MPETSSKPVILYDSNCPDGFGGAYAAWKKFGDAGTYLPMRRGMPVPDEVDGADVYFIDFVYDGDGKLEDVLKRASKVVLIDHHKSAQKHAEKFAEKVLEMDHSAATLAWKYFHGNTQMPQLLAYIELIDLGKFDAPGAREADAVLSLYDYDFEAWDTLINEFENDKLRDQYMRDGALLVRAEMRLVDRLVSHAEEVVFEGIPCLMVNSPTKVSYVGQKLYQHKPPIGIVWSRRGKKVIVSLRSDGSVDVAELAEKYGGGGHRQAAAFTWTEEEFLKFKRTGAPEKGPGS